MSKKEIQPIGERLQRQFEKAGRSKIAARKLLSGLNLVTLSDKLANSFKPFK